MVREVVDKGFELIDLDPRTAHIEHKSAIGESWAILYQAATHHNGQPQLSTIDLRGQKLQEGLHRAMHSCV